MIALTPPRYADVSKWETTPSSHDSTGKFVPSTRKKVPDFSGVCHGFASEGCDNELTICALIEQPDGTLHTPWIEMVQLHGPVPS